jgi:carbonic anhydrase
LLDDELLQNAEAYAASFIHGELALPPSKGIAILACMDARLNVYGLLGLHEGEAHVIRNAGKVCHKVLCHANWLLSFSSAL